MPKIDYENKTTLADEKLLRLINDAIHGWAIGHATIRIRYSRGADFSGVCFYQEHRILVNLGRHLKFPYKLKTHVARAKTIGRRWIKPLYSIQVADSYQVVLFVFLHELYHLLVKQAKRNPRQKESMCDRFATRYMVDHMGCEVRDESKRLVPRSDWDFQNVEAFVAAARDRRIRQLRQRPQSPVSTNADGYKANPQEQLVLFAC